MTDPRFSFISLVLLMLLILDFLITLNMQKQILLVTIDHIQNFQTESSENSVQNEIGHEINKDPIRMGRKSYALSFLFA